MVVREIPYPTRKSESEIQCLLWYFLRKRKIDAKLEVPGYYQLANGKYKRFRFDMVIFKDKTPVCVIECKSWSSTYSANYKYRKTENSKQLIEYENIFGLPIILVGRVEKINDTIREIEYVLGLKPIPVKTLGWKYSSIRHPPRSGITALERRLS